MALFRCTVCSRQGVDACVLDTGTRAAWVGPFTCPLSSKPGVSRWKKVED